MTDSILLSNIRIDGGTQMRAALNDETVADYAQTIREGTDFPPIILFFDGSSHWLADGFHRFHAYRAAGAESIEADVRQGTKRDAVLFSVGANASHGLRRSNEDKRKAVLTLLKDPEWCNWSDREIARRVGVFHQMVGTARASLDESSTPRTSSAKPDASAPADMGKTDREGARQAQRDAEAEAQRVRDENAAKLPVEVRDRMSAAEVARAGSTQPVDGETIGLSPEDRIAELEAENESLKADLAAKDDRLARLEPMEALFNDGGVDALLAAKDRVIESKDAMLRTQGDSLEKWKGECLSLRKRLNVEAPASSTVIDMQSGEVRNGVR